MALAIHHFRKQDASKGITHKPSVGIFGWVEASRKEGLGTLLKKPKI
jgi:hypothetical protein